MTHNRRSRRAGEALTCFRFRLFNRSLLTSAAAIGRIRSGASFGMLAEVHLQGRLFE